MKHSPGCARPGQKAPGYSTAPAEAGVRACAPLVIKDRSEAVVE